MTLFDATTIPLNMPLETIITFIGAAIMLSLIPGPDNIFVLTQSVINGRKAGLYITLGLCTGLIVHTSAVVFGVATLFSANSMAFIVLKSIGVVYLLYLAWQSFYAQPNEINQTVKKQISFLSLYRNGIIMNLTNPKVVMFFLAFFPQFTYPENGEISMQLSVLGGLFIASALLVFSSIAFLSGTLRKYLIRTPKIQSVGNKLASIVFIALAINLVRSGK